MPTCPGGLGLEADNAIRRAWWWLALGWVVLVWGFRPADSGSWSIERASYWSDLRVPHIVTAYRDGRTVAECLWGGVAPRVNGSWWKLVGNERVVIAEFSGLAFRWQNTKRDGGAWAWTRNSSDGSLTHWRSVNPEMGLDLDSSYRKPFSRDSGSSRVSELPLNRSLEYRTHSWIALSEDFVGTLGCGVWNWSSEVQVAPAPSLSWEEVSPPNWAVRCQARHADPRLEYNRSDGSGLVWWLNGSLAASVSYPRHSWEHQILYLVRAPRETSGPGSEGFSYVAGPPEWTLATMPTSPTEESLHVLLQSSPPQSQRPWFEVEMATGRLLLAEEAWNKGSLCVACAANTASRPWIAATVCRPRPLTRKIPAGLRRSGSVCTWSATAAAIGGVLFGALAVAALSLTLGVRPPRRGSVRLKESH
nr:membrane protein m167 [Mastomys natalensis cytomegalovirus 3]WEG70409.1 membrane protein m167 [Mastomys natalensis cytomegalovirus 3]WEG70549.1 membrane protein m167 [Mastomys natalensis cytomegalovirus 3]WEG70689.1 membrane protein m167 [Mastomys natalensis cytomegalovirus 3]WEG70969.1 membrane protein m167 [Mastomys natalensis cytomegalovirus 3]